MRNWLDEIWNKLTIQLSTKYWNSLVSHEYVNYTVQCQCVKDMRSKRTEWNAQIKLKLKWYFCSNLNAFDLKFFQILKRSLCWNSAKNALLRNGLRKIQTIVLTTIYLILSQPICSMRFLNISMIFSTACVDVPPIISFTNGSIKSVQYRSSWKVEMKKKNCMWKNGDRENKHSRAR